MTPRARLALLLIALLTIVTAVYAPVRRGVFVLGDRSLIEANPLVERGTVAQIFAHPYVPVNPLTDSRPVYYRPLTMLSLRADFQLAGLEAGSYHLTNLLLHLCATMALLLTARRLGASPMASTAAAGLWALLPRSTECVAWVSGRADVLAAIFALAAVGLWPWYADANADAGANATPNATHAARTRAALAGLAVLCGLLAKEVAIAAALAIVIGTVAGTRGTARERTRSAMRRLSYLMVPLLAYAALRWSATRDATSHISSLGAAPRAETMLEAVGRYFEMTLDPYHPTTTIGFAPEIDRPTMLLGAAVLAACLVLGVRALGRWPRARSTREPLAASTVAILVGAALGLGSLALVVHVVPIVVISSVAADRLLYLPLAGVALALAAAAARLSPRHRRIAGAIALVLGVTFIPVTRARARDYTDDLQFRVAAAEHSHPHNPTAKRALGLVLLSRGEVDLSCRLQESVSRTLAAMGPPARPAYLRAVETRAACYEVLGDYDRAAKLLAEVLAARPDGDVHARIGFLSQRTFAFDDAETSFRRALELDPTLDAARAALRKLPALRKEAARLQLPDARRADRVAWASLLTDLGRVGDATQAWYECALDPATPDDAAFEGVKVVIGNADLPTGRRVAESFAMRVPAETWVAARVRELVKARANDRASVDAVRARLEALAAQ